MAPRSESIGSWGAPPELKHLSTARNREYSRSSGERTGKSPNPMHSVGRIPMCVGGCTVIWTPVLRCHRVTNQERSRTVLERLARDGESPVDETILARG